MGCLSTLPWRSEHEMEYRCHTTWIVNVLHAETSIYQHQTSVAGFNQQTVRHTSQMGVEKPHLPIESSCESETKSCAVEMVNLYYAHFWIPQLKCSMGWFKPPCRSDLLSRPSYFSLSLYSIAARWWIVIPKTGDSVGEINRISQRLATSCAAETAWPSTPRPVVFF